MKTIHELINWINFDSPNDSTISYIESKKGVPQILLQTGKPTDLIEFYSLCGGLQYKPSGHNSYRIVTPDEFVRADLSERLQYALCREDLLRSGVTRDLYVIAMEDNSDETIVIDLSPKFLGRCYEAYPDKFGTPLSRVFAKSFTELLHLLVFQSREFIEESQCYGYFGDEILRPVKLNSYQLQMQRYPNYPQGCDYDIFWTDLKKRQDLNSNSNR